MLLYLVQIVPLHLQILVQLLHHQYLHNPQILGLLPFRLRKPVPPPCQHVLNIPFFGVIPDIAHYDTIIAWFGKKLIDINFQVIYVRSYCEIYEDCKD